MNTQERDELMALLRGALYHVESEGDDTLATIIRAAIAKQKAQSKKNERTKQEERERCARIAEGEGPPTILLGLPLEQVVRAAVDATKASIAKRIRSQSC